MHFVFHVTDWKDELYFSLYKTDLKTNDWITYNEEKRIPVLEMLFLSDITYALFILFEKMICTMSYQKYSGCMKFPLKLVVQPHAVLESDKKYNNTHVVHTYDGS